MLFTRRLSGWIAAFLSVAYLAYVVAAHLWILAAAWAVLTASVLPGQIFLARISSSLDRASDRELRRLLKAAGKKAVLYDRETGTVLMVERRKARVRTIVQASADSLNEAMSDFNMGASVSSMAYNRFVYRKGMLIRTDGAFGVRPGGDGHLPEVIDGDDPPGGVRAAVKHLLFLVRTRTGPVSAEDARELIEQLRRAVPMPEHDDE